MPPKICYKCGNPIHGAAHVIGSNGERQILYSHPRKCKTKAIAKQRQQHNGLSRAEGKIITFTTKPLRPKYHGEGSVRIRAAARQAILNGFDYLFLDGEQVSIYDLVQRTPGDRKGGG